MVGSSETYQLGSHNVSINLSVPTNYTVELPDISTNIKGYQLTITPNTGGRVVVSVHEGPELISDTIFKVADTLVGDAKTVGLGGLKYGVIEYRGYDAFEMYYPAQRIFDEDVGYIPYTESYLLAYQPDERTVIMIQTDAGESVYNELLSTLNVTKAVSNVKSGGLRASFIGPTSAYAGPGMGAKTGMENQNGVTVLGDSQSSNITVTARGGVK